MLSLLNTFCHGYVATPLLVLTERRGLLEYLHRTRPTALDRLVDSTQANAGYLQILLRALDSLGWVETLPDGYVLGPNVQLERVRPEVVELYEFAPRELVADERAQAVLAREVRLLLDDGITDGRPFHPAELRAGAVLLPLLIGLSGLQTEPSSVPLPRLSPALQDAVRRLFWSRHWVESARSDRLTVIGRELLERTGVMAIAGSYRTMLARLESLMFGDPRDVIDKGRNAEEIHVDRTMNVVASGYQHRRYFKEAEARLLDIFGGSRFDEQPKYIADTGCGDGTFLKLAYDLIREKTARGSRLADYPLTLIGVDCSPAALRETAQTLAGYPHITLLGDVSQPHQLIEDLRAHGVESSADVLHVRSFLDHDFRYDDAATTPIGADAHRLADAAYADSLGRRLPPERVWAAWQQNLRRWSDVVSPHGMIVLEAHCLPPGCARQHFAATESFYFDTLHALSQQYLVGADAFLTTAASVGLFPCVPPTTFPKTLPFCRVTLTHFTKRGYVIRAATAADLPSLSALERRCWLAALRAPESVLAERLRVYPSGQFVLEVEGQVVAVLYTQRTRTVGDIATSTAAETADLHHDGGPVVQLIALNVDPDWQQKQFGDQLLNFVLQVAGLTNGVRAVAGVTRCKSYDAGRHGPLHEYIAARDQRGTLLDPILNYHESHGATILEVVPDFRPLDTENHGCGVLIRYDLQTRGLAPKKRARSREHLSAGARTEARTEEIIRTCLGPRREGGYERNRPLMEMGLDSADLLELSEQVRSEFQLSLGPAFFFEHSTPAKVAAHIESARAALEDNAMPGNAKATSPLASPAPARRPTGTADIAIVGCSCRLAAGIDTPERLRAFLKAHGNAVGKIPPTRFVWPPDIAPGAEHSGIDRAALLEDIQSFDASFFRISPREAATMDPQQRILLELAWACLEDAGCDGALLSASRTGVFIGASGSDYRELLASRSTEGHAATGAAMALLSNRLSYFFDFRGPSIVVDTACSSSLVAVHQATQSLLLGECERALVGGINVICHPGNSVAYYKAGMLSAQGQCRTFDQDADGYVRAEGAVMMLLKPLERALADRDQIYAVIKGTACNHGGQSGGLTVPNPEQQARLLVDAWTQARVRPDTLEFLETHGTGTPLGDPLEIRGIRQAMAELALDPSGGLHCALGALKTNLGHLEAAAGISGLLKLALALRHAELLPNRSLHKLNEMIDLAGGPFYIPTETRGWPTPAGHPRRGGVSSFGLGGTNAHVVLEEFTGRPVATQPAPMRPLPFVLSARTPDALQKSAQRLLAHLTTGGEESFEAIAYTLQRRATFSRRLVLIASSRGELIERLADAVDAFEGAAVPALAIPADDDPDEGVGGVTRLAERWMRGEDIDWSELWSGRHCSAGQEPTVVALPTYPFATERHWLADQAPAARAPEPRIWTLAPDWGAIRPFHTGTSRARRHENVLVLSTIAPPPEAVPGRFIAIPKTSSDEVLAAYAACMDLISRAVLEKRPDHCVIVADEDEDIAWMLDGALRSVGREINVPTSWYSWDGPLPADVVLTSVVDDALDHAGEAGRWRLVADEDRIGCRPLTWNTREEEPALPPSLRRGGVYWITGGSGGIGGHLVSYLVREYDAHVVVCGRSPLDERRRTAMEAISASGTAGSVSYHRADCTNRSDMESLYRWTLDTHGQLHGIIHAAGVVRDRSLALRTPETVRAALEPKVLGTLVLDEVTSTCPLDFFLTFSSLTAIVGNPGQSDYAAANAFLRAHARRRRQLAQLGLRSGDTPVVHWPYWRDGGMRLDEARAARLGLLHGTAPMPTDVGLTAFVSALRRGRGEIAFVYGPSATLTHEGRDTRSAARRPVDAGPHGDIRALVTGVIADALAIPTEDLNTETHLVDYGLDSIALQNVARRLNDRLGLALGALDLHKHPTIERLARFLEGRLTGPPMAPTTVEPPTTPTAPPAPANADDEAIAIVGVSISIADAASLEEFERRLAGGKMSVTPYPSARWQALPPPVREGRQPASYRGAFLDGIDRFDAQLFNVSPREAMLMDPQHRLLLQSVWQAIEDAGYQKDEFAKRNTSVFVALGADDYATLADYDHQLDEFRGRGTRRYMAAHRISHFFDLEGASEAVDTACSSVFVAVDRACAALRSGLSEQAVVSGVQLNLLPTSFEQLERQGLLTARERMIPLDGDADGFIRAEGVGTIILKPASRARADHDHIYALVRGVGVWHAGKTMGLTAPNAAAHRTAMERALRQSGASVDDLAYVEAHGTGMGLGDASEIDAFNEVFRAHGRNAAYPCVLSAVKSTVGHLEAASGIAALLKAIVSLRSGVVPGVAGLQQPRAGLDSGFWTVGDHAEPLQPRRDETLRVGLNSYGLGGVSAFVVLEQASAPDTTMSRGFAEERGERIFVLSASTPDVLDTYLRRVGDFLARVQQSDEPFDFDAFIATFQSHRQHMRCRLAIVAASAADLLRHIEAVASGNASGRVYRAGQARASAGPSAGLESGDCDAMARAWVSGAAIPWPATLHRRQAFPTYPFDLRSRFWIRWADDLDRDQVPAEQPSITHAARYVSTTRATST